MICLRRDTGTLAWPREEPQQPSRGVARNGRIDPARENAAGRGAPGPASQRGGDEDLEGTKGASKEGVVSSNWFDRVFLSILYMFKPSS